ncbi:MAG: DNA polymerase X family [Parcubacteria group bacterium Gr01-1014_29]|nr:MAG: DNA polymerase X family [Parcubacteria group bacterium Gr01-1014_29]
MTNHEIAHILKEMALLLEMDDVPFKPRAYEKVAEHIEALDCDVADIYKKGGVDALQKEIPGVGRGIADHIERLLTKGTFPEYTQLKKKIPIDISELTSIEGIGPKMVRSLWKKLKIRNLADLEKAAKAGKIKNLPHFGEQSEKKILKGIEFLKKSGGRKVLGLILPELRMLEKTIQSFPGVTKALLAGSVRRRKETIGDVDILAISDKPEEVMERFRKLPEVAHVYGSGKTKTNVRLKNGLDADLRVVPEESFGAALNYFTGSKEHNVELRKIAIKKGLKLSEYGLFRGHTQIAGKTEEEIYTALGLQYIEPELREMNGEIEASRNKKLPKLIGYDDLKGDLQIQTNWTDGENSIEDMAREAERLGLEYIAITDHTKGLAMTGGSDEKKLEKQIKAIDRVNKKFQVSGFRFQVLKGAEVNILKDGSLDIHDETLAKLDVVGAAIHTNMKLSEKEQTSRIIRAMENPHVDIIFHLTGRIINSREAIFLDIDEIIKAAKRTSTILEIDAYPTRLDLKAEYIRKCVEAGVKMSIDSDAHAKKHFAFLEHGIAEARRGWAKKEDVVNTRPLKEFMKLLK